MMRKKESFTTITPIPGFIPRQLAVDILHSHPEVITLNPLVIDHRAITAPRDAAADEFYATWYEITERMQFVPGLGKMGSGKIKFNGCFHDLPNGLQTHTYAPMNIDIRIKYRVDGNQPGIEPPPHMELGLAELGAPRDGLYLREDIEIRCNVTLSKYVKEGLKTASKEMVSRIIKKAELLDAGVLQAMIEDGKIRTINPNDRSAQGGMMRSPSYTPDGPGRSSTSPRPASQLSQHGLQQQGLSQSLLNPPPGSPGPVAYQVPRASMYGAASYQYNVQQPSPGQPSPGAQQQNFPMVAELPPEPAPSQSFVAELPGSFYEGPTQHELQQQQQQQQQQISPHVQPLKPQPGLSPDPNSASSRWSQSSNGFANGQGSPFNSSRPTSMSSDTSSTAGLQSPGLGGFSSDLATHRETQEEHGAPDYRRMSEGQPKQNPYAAYNPADYARMR